ncbi:unnamed protein product [Tilletia caries]|uniref:J domain-containing protein n=1 Tax=Tilletia controversa TaxID=13291 RepID=A0A8X7MTX4_9BASI|nr:hypothetical protein CF328_g3592 [Tilletia controversa]CAD6885669.1 unnamed protein product [Tilletia caries]KAE8247554.1 hypothetical protein A4X06_0g4366 [Tilletia controversa]CAD6960758.1 unnamed protein product [Tilletia controversa]CAD6968232.1 unnamed protein product [Tilletia controversa]
MAGHSNSDCTPAQMEAIERILRANGDPYVILDLPMDSSDPEALKAAKRQGVLLIHPDKNSHPQAADAFRMLIEAFDRLHSLMRINPSSSSDEMTEVGSATEELTPQERQAYNRQRAQELRRERVRQQEEAQERLVQEQAAKERQRAKKRQQEKERRHRRSRERYQNQEAKPPAVFTDRVKGVRWEPALQAQESAQEQDDLKERQRARKRRQERERRQRRKQEREEREEARRQDLIKKRAKQSKDRQELNKERAEKAQARQEAEERWHFQQERVREWVQEQLLHLKGWREEAGLQTQGQDVRDPDGGAHHEVGFPSGEAVIPASSTEDEPDFAIETPGWLDPQLVGESPTFSNFGSDCLLLPNPIGLETTATARSYGAAFYPVLQFLRQLVRITPAVSNEILMAAGTWTLERHGSVAQA